MSASPKPIRTAVRFPRRDDLENAPPPRSPARFFPEFTLPSDWRDHLRECDRPPPGAAEPERFAFLHSVARAGLIRRYGETPPAEAEERLRHELSVVEQVGYGDYFLIVWDICREARRRGIPYLARGSAADSLACYCLLISTVCPLRFQLCFERFLNPERMKFSKLADIDLDFPWDQRDELMQYVFERYGVDHVAMIGGFNRFHGRAAVADVGKVFGLSEGEVRDFTRRIPATRAGDIIKGIKERPAVERDLPWQEEPYPLILEIARQLEGVPRHPMMHPCGIVISKPPLTDLMPLMPSGRGPMMTQFDMDAVEDMGLVKIDLLGQAGLAVLRDVTREVARRHGVMVDFDAIPWDDEATWDMIATGGARGVHHIESPAMTTLLVQAGCRDMDCLCAIVSVIRPGAADESKKLAFTRRHQGFEAAVYPHPDLEPWLRDTYGLLVYEEHILQVAHHFAGMNLGRADVLRRELVKMKDPEKIQELGTELRTCALAKGYSEEETNRVWDALERFHGYMFNKAHSASYAVEAWHGAWLKARWPAEYMAAVLNNERGFYTAFFYTLEARRLGIRMLPPCVNHPAPSFQAEETPDGPGIRVPLRYIKNLSTETLARWQREIVRRPFAGVADLVCRVHPPPAEMELLLQTGALDRLQPSRTAAFWEWKRTERDQGSRVQEEAQTNFFVGLQRPVSTGGPASDTAVALTEPDLHERAGREIALLGFPVSLDPWECLAPGFDWAGGIPLAELGNYHHRLVTVAGLIVQKRHNHTLKGQLMMFGTLADPSGFVECTVFPDVYRACGHHLERGGLLLVKARVDPFDNGRGQTLEILWMGSPEKVKRASSS